MQELIPITLFISLAYAIQAIADARARSRLVAPHISEDVIAALVLAEQQRRRLSSLRWGVVLIVTALGLAALQVIGWNDLTPGFAAVLVGAIGLGNVVSYAIASKFGQITPHSH
jgi:hypothetical protein